MGIYVKFTTRKPYYCKRNNYYNNNKNNLIVVFQLKSNNFEVFYETTNLHPLTL